MTRDFVEGAENSSSSSAVNEMRRAELGGLLGLLTILYLICQLDQFFLKETKSRGGFPNIYLHSYKRKL